MIELVLSSIQSILQVMVTVMMGAILSKFQYIDSDKQKWLSKLSMVLFTPCLLFSNIAPIICFEKFLEFWPIPVFFLLFTFISWILCTTTSPLFRVSKHYQRFVMGCVMFSNNNSLPVAIISSLAVSEAGKVLLLGEDDSPESVAARGISYTVFLALFSNLLRWSYGYNLLRNSDDDVEHKVINYNKNYGTMYNHQVSAPPENRLTVKKSSCGNLETENEMEQLSSGAKKRANRFLDFFHSINKFMSPPLWAALLGLVVGLTPPLKSIMYSKDSFVYASVTRSIESCGKASVPIVLISLGAQLHSMQLNNKHISDQEMKKPVALSIFIRMVLAPMCVIPIVWLFSKFGQHISNLAIDPMFIVAMIIMGCTPTAINLTQITQVTGAFEVEMLHVLFWSYGVICIPVCTFVVFISLTIVS